ncbi:MAG: hypothetical protein ACI8R9_000663 [Paraglaciecola sp.]|jgi:hypothetical protein
MWAGLIGNGINKARLAAQEQNLTKTSAELAASQTTLANLALFPLVLVFAFSL